eukprot:TRINITY_DN6377_c0_g1_i2.p1 TRINITY_DN6377_c0_g1~~TRINITY_DN6377_c0_g1_i2.p1  ORF type:complete len:515 (+),score=119.47 TRINITY_DN6377_c0_g1_i2:269-1813(+)
MALISRPQDDVLSLFLLQVIVVLVTVRLIGTLLAKLKQPRVVGEILAGVLLGPTVLCRWPWWEESVFPSASLPYLNLVANLGLVFFMFLVGMECDRKLMVRTFRSSALICAAGVIPAFAVGIGLGVMINRADVEFDPVNDASYHLVVGAVVAFGAFPILARLLGQLGIQKTPLGLKVLSVAAVEDVVAWTAMALILAYHESGSVLDGVIAVALEVVFFAIMAFVARYLVWRVHVYLIAKNDEMNPEFIAGMFFLLCVCAFVSEVLHVHAFYGAFVFGMLVPRQGKWIAKMIPRLELIVVELFLPLYFAKSGMKTQFEFSGKTILFTLILIAVAMIAKFVPVAIAARLADNDPRSSLAFGILLNTRGLKSLIVLNIAFDSGIIGPITFAMLIVFILVTLLIAPPLLRFVYINPAIGGNGANGGGDDNPLLPLSPRQSPKHSPRGSKDNLASPFLSPEEQEMASMGKLTFTEDMHDTGPADDSDDEEGQHGHGNGNGNGSASPSSPTSPQSPAKLY